MKQIFPLEVSVINVVVQQLILEGLLAQVVHLALADDFLFRWVDVDVLFNTLHHVVEGFEVFRVQSELWVNVSAKA